MGSPLFIQCGRVTLPHSFCNWSPCSSFYFARQEVYGLKVECLA